MSQEGNKKKSYGLIGLALTLCVVSTYIAFTQEPHPDPFQPRAFPEKDWWLYPQETNAFKRLPAINSDLNDIHVSKNGKKVWVVGNRGMIAHSRDGGKTWERQTFGNQKETPQQTPAQAAQLIPGQRAPSLNIIDEAFAADAPSRGKKNPKDSKTQEQLKTKPPTTPGNNVPQQEIRKIDPKSKIYPPPSTSKPQQQTIAKEQKAENETIQEPSAQEIEPPIQQELPPAIQQPLKENTTVDPTTALNDIFCIDELQCWAVGSSGIILVTTKGGATWTTQSSGTNTSLYAVTFVSPTDGWAVGGRGTILSTTDGGANWKPQIIPEIKSSLLPLNDVEFVSARKGWIVGGLFTGGPGIILSTKDGGKTWELNRQATTLFSVMFTSPEGGWIVGDNGIFLKTLDGGNTWEKKKIPNSPRLFSVHFDSASLGWAAGLKGAIFTTSDGGNTWNNPQHSPTTAILEAITFHTPTQGWAVGSNGTILATKDGGGNWTSQTKGEPTTFKTADFVDSSLGWLVGTGGSILHTQDGGETWIPQSRSGNLNDGLISLEDVQFISSTQGWVIGNNQNRNGIVFSTTDGGATWTTLSEFNDAKLISVFFMSPQEGWVATEYRGIFHTIDGGKTWEIRPINFQLQSISHVQFISPNQGWAVGYNMAQGGIILKTLEDKSSWKMQASFPAEIFTAIHFPSDSIGWVVGKGGKIYSTTDGGKRWKRQESGTQLDLTNISFFSQNEGWALGQNGLILSTANGGKDWKEQESGTKFDLRDIHFSSQKQGWALGNGGSFLITTDGGKTWENRVHYSWAPAPWYWLLGWATPLVLLVWAFRARPDEVTIEKSIAGALASDRPLEVGDPDPLGFQRIALGLSRFLRHKKTKPPLTIAITGEWGTGKSSLMNLLNADLKRFGFCPVWFNAWHHQKEEHLLASLLEAVRTTAIPPWWTTAHWRFRRRLLWLRGKKHVWPVLLLFALMGGSGGYLEYRHQSISTFFAPPVETQTLAPQPAKDFKNTDSVQSPNGPTEDSGTTGLSTPNTAGKGSAENTETKAPQNSEDLSLWQTFLQAWAGKDGDEIFSFLTLLTGALGAVGAFFRSWIAFWSKPSNLLASISGKSSSSTLTAQTGFRQTFTQEFREVSQALMPRHFPIVIIDDLDRCQPDKVLDVLEAINFLVASGDCVVVMGLARERVEHCVGLGFKDIAEDGLDSSSSPQPSNVALSSQEQTDKRAAKEKRDAFAKQYLEKLINIEVPIPTLNHDQGKALVRSFSHEDQNDIPKTFGSALKRSLSKQTLFRENTLLGLGVLLIFVIATIPFVFPPSFTPQPALKETRDPVDPLPPKKELQVKSDTSSSPNKDIEEPLVKKEIASLIPGEPGEAPTSVGLVLVFAIIGAGLLWRWTRREKIEEEDSLEFMTALQLWTPVVMAKQQSSSPRAIKRFFNHVRYMAMFQRHTPPPSRLWERYLLTDKEQTLLRQSRETSNPDNDIRESLLVGLSAIHHFRDDLIEDDGQFKKVKTGFAGLSSNENEFAPLQEKISEHREKEHTEDKFPPWEGIEKHRFTFLERRKGFV